MKQEGLDCLKVGGKKVLHFITQHDMSFLRHVYQKNTQLPCSRTLKAKVIFPCYNELDIAFVTHDKDTVHDFIAYIWEQASKEKQLLIPFPMEELQLLHNRTEQLLNRSKPLRHYLLLDNDVFYLIKNVSESNLNAVEYSEFIRYSYPGLNSLAGMSTIDFPVANGSIVLKFGNSRKRRSAVCLYTPALVDYRALSSAKTGDMISSLGGNIREARKRGYISWTDKDYTQRVYLLRLSDEASKSGFSYNDFTNIERVRYSATGVLNRGYDGGDSRSWQRYTTDQVFTHSHPLVSSPLAFSSPLILIPAPLHVPHPYALPHSHLLLILL